MCRNILRTALNEQPLAAEQLEAALMMLRGGAGDAGPGPMAGLRPLGCSAPLQRWTESSTTPPRPLLLPRREKASQQRESEASGAVLLEFNINPAENRTAAACIDFPAAKEQALGMTFSSPAPR